jgi:hypothetical protein
VQTEASVSAATTLAERGEVAAEPDLWRVLAQTEQLGDFARAWLALVSRASDGARQCALLLGPPDRGPYAVLARFPERAARADDAFLSETANVLNAALEKRRPAIEGIEDAVTRIGYPLVFSGLLHGAVIVEMRSHDTAAVRRTVRHLQWSAAGVEAFLGRDGFRQALASADKAQFLIGTIDALAAEEHGSDAARALANALARRMACDSVAIGRYQSKRSRLVAVSQSATIDRRSAVSRSIEAAQDEAIDQETALIAPTLDTASSTVTGAHERLSRSLDGAQVLTVPLFSNDGAIGAITLRRDSARFTQVEVDLADALGEAAGPLLYEKWQLDRSLPRLVADRGVAFFKKLVGPRHFTLKAIAVAIVGCISFLALATDIYRVRARAAIQGETRRLVSAPFDGFISSQFARAGDVVAADSLLAELQDNDLELERLRQIAHKRQYQLELDKALANRDLAAVNIARAQIEQADAEIDLSDQMIARAKLRAPFDAVVVGGDLSQSVGKPVSRGDTLFELAPLDRYRMTAVVPESEIAAVKVGQKGELLLSALPDRTFPVEIYSLTPVAQSGEGVNGFEVLGTLDTKDQGIRPGMEGVVKIEIGRRNIAWIWTHPMIDWMRLKIWGLVP